MNPWTPQTDEKWLSYDFFKVASQHHKNWHYSSRIFMPRIPMSTCGIFDSKIALSWHQFLWYCDATLKKSQLDQFLFVWDVQGLILIGNDCSTCSSLEIVKYSQVYLWTALVWIFDLQLKEERERRKRLLLLG